MKSLLVAASESRLQPAVVAPLQRATGRPRRRLARKSALPAPTTAPGAEAPGRLPAKAGTPTPRARRRRCGAAWPCGALAAVAIMALLGGCATTATGPGAVASRPLVAALAKTPPLIDGRLDDPAWRRAASTGLFGAPFPPGDASLVGRPEYRTEAKVLWDAEHLYVAFICYAPAIYATMQKHDDRLYEQDVTEVFLDVGTDGAQYAELQVSPKAVTADHFHRWAPPPTFPADKLDWDQASKNHQMEDWDLKGFQAATAPLLVAGQSVGWTVELAIPLGELLSRRGSPARLQRGQVVRANLLRYVWLPGPKPEDQRLHRQLNWSPVMNGCPHVSPMAMRPIRCGR